MTNCHEADWSVLHQIQPFQYSKETKKRMALDNKIWQITTSFFHENNMTIEIPPKSIMNQQKKQPQDSIAHTKIVATGWLFFPLNICSWQLQICELVRSLFIFRYFFFCCSACVVIASCHRFAMSLPLNVVLPCCCQLLMLCHVIAGFLSLLIILVVVVLVVIDVVHFLALIFCHRVCHYCHHWLCCHLSLSLALLLLSFLALSFLALSFCGIVIAVGIVVGVFVSSLLILFIGCFCWLLIFLFLLRGSMLLLSLLSTSSFVFVIVSHPAAAANADQEWLQQETTHTTVIGTILLSSLTFLPPTHISPHCTLVLVPVTVKA